MSFPRAGRRLAAALTLALVTALAWPAAPVHALTTHTVSSPGGNISFAVTEQANGSLTYKVSYGAQTIIDTSPLGITTNAGDFTTGLTYVSQSTGTVNETYSLPGRKKTTYTNNANTLTLRYSKGSRNVDLVIRAYNDGIAYRYAIPGSGAATISAEKSGFKLPAGTGGWAFDWRNDYEGFYDYRSAAGLETGTFGMPVLLSVNNNSHWALLTEGNVYNANGSYHTSRLAGAGSGTGLLNVSFAPEQTSAVSTTYPFQTPWRVAIIGDQLGDLVESTLVTNLNPPSEVADTSWIKPGRAAWSWWSDEPSGADLAKQKQYVDEAAKLGFEYVTVDCCWVAADIPVIVDYAKSRNVKIFIWTDMPAIDTQAELDQKLPLWKSWGVAGLKVDFFMNDSQATMATYDRIATSAAANQLMLNFHGSTKPSGESRTWPHVITSEGIRGSEHYKWSDHPHAKHNATVPFTRNILGSMDYTPVVFSQSDQNTTHAHQLALSVLFESHQQNFAESVAGYGNWTGRHLLKAVPTVWDDVKLVEGFPDDYATIARRSGGDWYVGAVTDAARTATIPLTFLGSGSYTATIFKDGTTDQSIVTSTQTVTSASTLSIPLRLHGGAAVHISTSPLKFDGAADNNYEAEAPGNTLTGASRATCNGCSAREKVGNIGGTNTLQFNGVSAGATGSHQMVLVYSASDARTIYVSVNGGANVAVPLLSTGGWDVVGSATVAVSLNAGSANTVKISNAGGWAPDIDRLSIGKAIEAEAAGNTLSGGAAVSACGACSGGQKVSNIGSSATLTVNGVPATSTGSKTVTVHYAAAEARTAYLSVNGGAAVPVLFPATGGWSTPGAKTFALTLANGTNSISFSNSGGWAPDIDRIEVTS
jgi:alpha-glucosidase